MAAPSYQSIATFDYVVSPHSDDFGPFTSGTTTGGLQEALTTAGAGGSVFVRKGTYSLHTNIAQKGHDQTLFCEPGVTFLAASDYAPGFGVVGMFSLGQDGTSDYDGFVFEGNGCLIDGQNFASTAGLFVTGSDSGRPHQWMVHHLATLWRRQHDHTGRCSRRSRWRDR